MSNPMRKKGRRVLKLGITRADRRVTELSLEWLHPEPGSLSAPSSGWTPVTQLDLPVIAF